MSKEPFDYGELDAATGQYERHPTSIGLTLVQPLRDTYRHTVCGKTTTINDPNIVLSYATQPSFYNGTFCVTCRAYYPLKEFVWLPDEAPMDKATGDPKADLRVRRDPKVSWTQGPTRP
jgi:hypothetical protein